MIGRIWHGTTPAEKADSYLEFLNDRAVPDYESIDGNLGVYLFRRLDGDEAHFLTLTFWESEAAIRAFAGDPIDAAKYYPEDDEYLVAFEPTVTHYEVYPSRE
ncbi:antibiotic biosynthesis monooxygenase family protein [Halosolutus gelatinilyticus]|uniref:antibiotic biosynthesis monooxygenase family protein n=1 Tax=Halosolutus gelatinilyticus TaxID=2931975 RepID=UPI001FF45574|nr:antibiotic biosynthesis monooxygenase [Halosolutus gelatinilyticus]